MYENFQRKCQLRRQKTYWLVRNPSAGNSQNISNLLLGGQHKIFIFVKVSQYLKLLMFGCFGVCGDCFSTSPIPLLVKRFYCSFAIQSKERKEREEEEEKVLFNRKVGE